MLAGRMARAQRLALHRTPCGRDWMPHPIHVGRCRVANVTPHADGLIGVAAGVLFSASAPRPPGKMLNTATRCDGRGLRGMFRRRRRGGGLRISDRECQTHPLRAADRRLRNDKPANRCMRGGTVQCSEPRCRVMREKESQTAFLCIHPHSVGEWVASQAVRALEVEVEI